MKLFRTHKKMVVAGVALTVAIFGGGAAFAFLTSSGTGTGSASVAAQPSGLTIDQLGGTPMYNSIIDNSAYQWSMSYGPSTVNQFGNEITLAGGGQPLSDVVVSMASGEKAGATDVGPIPITLNVYAPGGPYTNADALWTDIVTVTPPTTSTGYDPTLPGYGITSFDVTFSNFTNPSGDYYPGTALPSTVVYGIAYDNTTVDTSLNVNMSYETPSVGSDTTPGKLFASSSSAPNAAGGSNGELACSDVGSAFTEYSVASGNGGLCGLDANPAGNLIPAVEFDTSAMTGLYPGGTQPINFSITNPGTIPQTVNSVTIAVTGTASCGSSNFAMLGGNDPSGTDSSNTYTVGVDPTTIQAGGTVDFLSSTTKAILTMLNSTTVDQDACEGAQLNLAFSSK
jgi:hypothetical protein